LDTPYKYKLSVIIVNYNVEYFLEQCLNSVKKSLEKVSGEVFVVDNNSIDGSVDMVREKFPEFQLIANKDNKGFSSANNQGIQLSNGEYVLLLNPDTVVEEDTFYKVINFMDEHPNAGGLGVRMLDGKGSFLPESKRGLPTPEVAFYKVFGISRLLSKSKKFGRYHLGYLSEFETNEIEILSGAFMLMRKEALDKVGLLDEAFFMYGEDIDLSYRILKGGYKNYYFPETRIIHYKGESTKKSSVNYVFVFYRAMVIFAEKHFSKKNAKLFSFLINGAIYFRAFLALITRFIQKTTLPLIDAFFLISGLFLTVNYWKKVHVEFPLELIKTAILSYTAVWMLSLFFNNGYDNPIKLKSVFKGTIIGTLIILIVYGLLPKDWQFSRLFILTGTCWVILYYLLSRFYLHAALKGRFTLSPDKNKKYVIVGTIQEARRVSDLLKQTNDTIELIEFVSPEELKSDEFVGTINQLDQIVFIHGIHEVIFCAKDTTAQTIITWMSALSNYAINFKIAQPESMFLIGSNSIDTAGDLYILNINSISRKSNIRNKRTFDILLSMVLFVFLPILVLRFRNKKKFIQNIFEVIIGNKSLVGYSILNLKKLRHLPKIKNGILTPLDLVANLDQELTDKLNLIYARDYKIGTDFKILLKAWRKLDH
jgi:GT2 family glycosyltransferase